MSTIEKMIKVAEAEVGYLEKASNSGLDSPTGNAGSANYTKFWRDLAPAMNGSAWCNCFVNWVFTQAFGTETAKKLLCTDGNWSYYTPTSAGYFKKNGQWYTSDPKAGDIIYFKNSQRIHHVGIVVQVDGLVVVTIEGNTSSGTQVVANGGAVAKKKYLITNEAIAGYGRPDYAHICGEAGYTVGWNQGENGWWYADTETTFFASVWKRINGCWYYFDADGYAVKGPQTIDGKRYYFEDTAGAPKECALMKTDDKGALYAWTV